MSTCIFCTSWCKVGIDGVQRGAEEPASLRSPIVLLSLGMWFTINYSILGISTFMPLFKQVYASSKEDAERNLLQRHPSFIIYHTTPTYDFHYGPRNEPLKNI